MQALPQTSFSPANPHACDPVAIAANLKAVRARIAAAASAASRPPDAVHLIAVSKGHTQAAVRAALAAGQRDFGENRVQEAAAKFAPLRAEFPDLRLHLVGPLQTNKVRDALALFDAILSVDRPKLARALAAERAHGVGRVGAVFVQVNTGEEPQKAGVAPEATDELVALCRALDLPVAGLMCLPPLDEPPELHFALLAAIARRNGLAGLSMGMSDDYEVAVRMGATHVRVGTAIFGARPGPLPTPAATLS